MASASSLREFYETTKFILPPRSKNRQFILMWSPRKFHKIPFSVRHESELRDYCIDALPDAVYFMTSRFNNAKNISSKHPKGCDPIACNTFLGAELYFDLDLEDFGNSMRELLKAVLKLYSYLAEKYDNIKFVFSGRGFHIWVLDFEEKFFGEEMRAQILLSMKPAIREALYYRVKKTIAEDLSSKGYGFDMHQITWDTRRILRVPGSFNEKSFQKVVYFNSLPIDFLSRWEAGEFKLPIADDADKESLSKASSSRMIKASLKEKSREYREKLGGPSPKHAKSFVALGRDVSAQSSLLDLAVSHGRAPILSQRGGDQIGNTR
jgi:DNA primase catalytic subunit